jgi:hypothetical protein
MLRKPADFENKILKKMQKENAPAENQRKSRECGLN